MKIVTSEVSNTSDVVLNLRYMAEKHSAFCNIDKKRHICWAAADIILELEDRMLKLANIDPGVLKDNTVVSIDLSLSSC